MLKETVKINDKQGFVYELLIEYFPHLGLSTARYRDSLMASVEYGSLSQPCTDNDSEWERYQERLEDWKSDAKSDLVTKC